MRSTVILICLVVLVLLRVADPFVCPDGCVDAPHEESSSSTHVPPASNGDCLLCHGGLTAPTAVAVLTLFVTVASVVNIDLRTMTRPVPRFDPPPRVA